MKRTLPSLCLAALVVCGLVGCESSESKPEISTATKSETPTDTPEAPGEIKSDPSMASDPKPTREPDYITVQHCLIAFSGSLPGTPIARSKAQAKELATKLLEEARAGADFAEIIKKNTDDSPPGIYKMANRSVPVPDGAYSRDKMVPAFGDTGFPLKVGEFGLAEFDPNKSPYGWHIVKRIE